MLTWQTQKPMGLTANGTSVFYGVGDCLSTDTKPTDGVYNGSALYEIDTKKSYKFNAETGTWVEAATSNVDAAIEKLVELDAKQTAAISALAEYDSTVEQACAEHYDYLLGVADELGVRPDESGAQSN